MTPIKMCLLDSICLVGQNNQIRTKTRIGVFCWVNLSLAERVYCFQSINKSRTSTENPKIDMKTMTAIDLNILVFY